LDFLIKKEINQDEICFVAIGSVGRYEALKASDLDILPIIKKKETLIEYKKYDNDLRNELGERLQIKISKGKDLTQCTLIDDIIDPSTIGDENDSSSALTKRVLTLTESTQICGGYDLNEVRNEILQIFARYERTSGKHVLSFCNDIARYYRTLFIEYKAKIDNRAKDWCTRNMKLQHSRKFWYFVL